MKGEMRRRKAKVTANAMKTVRLDLRMGGPEPEHGSSGGGGLESQDIQARRADRQGKADERAGWLKLVSLVSLSVEMEVVAVRSDKFGAGHLPP